MCNVVVPPGQGIQLSCLNPSEYFPMGHGQQGVLKSKKKAPSSPNPGLHTENNIISLYYIGKSSFKIHEYGLFKICICNPRAVNWISLKAAL